MRIKLLSLAAVLVFSTPLFADDVLEREVETAARNFRIQTYQTFRNNRNEYNRRIELANEAMRRFKFAKQDTDQQILRDWFVAANQNNVAMVPEIELMSANEMYAQEGRNQNRPVEKTQRDKNKGKRNADGFIVTEYKNNPRFQSNETPEGDEEQTVSTKPNSKIGGLFQDIGKSFLRTSPGNTDSGDDSNDSDNGNSDTFTEVENADDIWSNDDENDWNADGSDVPDTSADKSSDNNLGNVDQLNSEIIDLNLAVGLLNEDFDANEDDSINALVNFVERLEKLDEQLTSLGEKRQFLSDEDQMKLTPFGSLEETSTKFLTAINETATRIAFGDDADAEAESKLKDLRMRVSRVLAAHTS